MKDENEINVLDELNKGACMGMDAIHYIIDKVENKSFKDILNLQYNKYKEIHNKISDVYPDYSEKTPHETNAMDKAMTWYGIEIRTFMDSSDSKLAELLLQGTNMGIIEGRRLLNHKKTDKNVKMLIEEYVNMQEKLMEDIKQYL